MHNATEAQYQKLHSLMAAQGLVRYITSNTGTRSWLPPAEYYFNGVGDAGGVRSAAKICAAAVVPGFAILVTEATNIVWEGLQAA